MNKQKQQLLESLEARGFSKKILEAFSKVKRENFVPLQLKNQAYEDNALPISQGQTISQPYTIAVMLSLLNIKDKSKDKQKTHKILEVGSGCGYVLALLSEIINHKSKGEVYGIEIVKELTEKSRENLKNLKYTNVKVYNKNGADGLPEYAPFDRILISAACKEIPLALFSQLKENGIIVAPVDSGFGYGPQSLVAIKKIKNKPKIIKQIPGFVFVRFVGG